MQIHKNRSSSGGSRIFIRGGAKDVHARTSQARNPKFPPAGVQGPLKDPGSSRAGGGGGG